MNTQPHISGSRAKFSFRYRAAEKWKDFGGSLVVQRHEHETNWVVLMKILGFLLFHRPRLQLEMPLSEDSLGIVPHLVQHDYQLMPALAVECGPCETDKLAKMAIKAPDAELWIIQSSRAEAEELLEAMRRHNVRRGRYRLLAFDPVFLEELSQHLHPRNEVFWIDADFETSSIQLDFNGLWYETEFHVLDF